MELPTKDEDADRGVIKSASLAIGAEFIISGSMLAYVWADVCLY